MKFLLEGMKCDFVLPDMVIVTGCDRHVVHGVVLKKSTSFVV